MAYIYKKFCGNPRVEKIICFEKSCLVKSFYHISPYLLICFVFILYTFFVVLFYIILYFHSHSLHFHFDFMYILCMCCSIHYCYHVIIWRSAFKTRTTAEKWSISIHVMCIHSFFLCVFLFTCWIRSTLNAFEIILVWYVYSSNHMWKNIQEMRLNIKG